MDWVNAMRLAIDVGQHTQVALLIDGKEYVEFQGVYSIVKRYEGLMKDLDRRHDLEKIEELIDDCRHDIFEVLATTIRYINKYVLQFGIADTLIVESEPALEWLMVSKSESAKVGMTLGHENELGLGCWLSQSHLVCHALKTGIKANKIIEVNPLTTSSTCHRCHEPVVKEGFKVTCWKCKYTMDRDHNACLNIDFQGLMGKSFSIASPPPEIVVLPLLPSEYEARRKMILRKIWDA